MAKSRALSNDDIYEASPEPQGARVRVPHAVNGRSESASPSTSASSDKENRASQQPDKGKGRASGEMGPPKIPTPTAGQPKRKRTGTASDGSTERQRRRRTIEVGEEALDADDYDPDQDREERREVRRGYREQQRLLNENRIEYMQPHSTGLIDALHTANELSNNVKQTSEATVDSRHLVNVADAAYKKTLAVFSGDSTQGVDIDDFISKCKAYMNRAAGALAGQQAQSSTQRRRRTAADEDEESGDALNWEHLGRHACQRHIARPSLPGFLLGPLSLEKRARKAVVRKAPLKANALRETQPEVIKAGDVERNENENLTTLCTQIMLRLEKLIEDGQEAVDAQNYDGISKDEINKLLDKHAVSEDGGLSYYRFVINPNSFGQSIENIFYVSFLIKDGKLGIEYDSDGFPFLMQIPPEEEREATEDDPKKGQAVIALDMQMWEDLIDVFDMKMKPSMILHREETDHAALGGKGWYA